MHLVTRILNWGGATSIALGGLLALVGFLKDRGARRLEAAVPVPTLEGLKQLLNAVPLLIAVTGRVWAAKPVKGELSDEAGAIVEVTEERVSERRTEVGQWVKETDPVRSVTREAEWSLEDGSGVRLMVVHGHDAEGDFMQVMANEWSQSSDSIMHVAVSELSGRRFLGTRRVERALPLGTEVTAVGELAAFPDRKPREFQGTVRSKGLMYVLREPRAGGPFLITRQRLPELIATLRAASGTCNRLSAAFVALGAGLLLASAVNQAASWWWQKRQRARLEQIRRERGEAAAAAAEAASGGNGDEAGAAAATGGDSVCIVCWNEPLTMVFPCGHMCVCEECSKSLDRCPFCRARGRPIRVFRP